MKFSLVIQGGKGESGGAILKSADSVMSEGRKSSQSQQETQVHGFPHPQIVLVGFGNCGAEEKLPVPPGNPNPRISPSSNCSCGILEFWSGGKPPSPARKSKSMDFTLLKSLLRGLGAFPMEETRICSCLEQPVAAQTPEHSQCPNSSGMLRPHPGPSIGRICKPSEFRLSLP